MACGFNGHRPACSTKRTQFILTGMASCHPVAASPMVFAPGTLSLSATSVQPTLAAQAVGVGAFTWQSLNGALTVANTTALSGGKLVVKSPAVTGTFIMRKPAKQYILTSAFVPDRSAT